MTHDATPLPHAQATRRTPGPAPADSPVAALAAVLLAVLLGACATPAVEPAGLAAGADSAEQKARQEPRYLRFKAEDTRLVAAIDDGQNTYLEFAGPTESGLALFDQDGRPLVFAPAGPVAAVAGLHRAVLLKLGERASLVSPNPRWRGAGAAELPQRSDYLEARAKLENQALLQAAMERALAASNRAAGAARPPDDSSAPPPGMAVGSVAVRGQASDPLRPGLATTPLAMANLTSSAAGQGLIRVFFATASRAIVAPDDGLAVLLREAPKADEIRITGFTDALGARAANLRLAESRADAVAQILYRRGIPPARVVVDAVAADEFIAENATDRGRALNRRAEIVLLKAGRPMALGQSTAAAAEPTAADSTTRRR